MLNELSAVATLTDIVASMVKSFTRTWMEFDVAELQNLSCLHRGLLFVRSKILSAIHFFCSWTVVSRKFGWGCSPADSATSRTPEPGALAPLHAYYRGPWKGVVALFRNGIRVCNCNPNYFNFECKILRLKEILDSK